MQELSKVTLKISLVPNGLEKYMIFTINNKLSFIDSFRFLSSALYSLVKSLNEDHFKHLSQKRNKNKLDFVKQKDFILINIGVILKSSKKNYLAKKNLKVF